MPAGAWTIGSAPDRRIDASVLQRIGGTPLVALRRIVPERCARLLIKLESANPTGSMKDRMALAMIEAAERSGRLKPGGRVVEYTGGSTGVSLAFICAARGYSLSLVTSDAFSIEKRRHMAALGAELTIVPSTGGGMDASLTRNMIAAARQIAGADRRLLDRPAQQHRSARRLSCAGGRDLGPDGRPHRRLRAKRRDCRVRARRRRVLAPPEAGHPYRRGRAGGVRRPLWRSDRGPQDRGRRRRLRGSACGIRPSPTKSPPSRPRRRWRWRGVLRARRRCSPAPRPARTSSPRSRSACASARTRRSSR